MKKINYALIFLLAFSAFVFCFSGTVNAAGAFFYFSPSTGSKSVDTIFPVTIKVNTGDAVINAAEGSISFDANKLEVVGLNESGSIFNMWIPSKPTYNNKSGVITFGGGVPQPGYTGKIGNVLTISFKAKAVGDAQIHFSAGAILANDSLGTNILTSMGSASFTIVPKSDAPKEEISPATAENSEGESEHKNTSVVLQNDLNITSPTHSNQEIWYGQNNIEFKWVLPSGATEENFSFDNSPTTDPGAQKDGLVAYKKYDDVKDGIWYFHLKVKGEKDWTPVSHFKVQIDTTPPAPFKISVDQGTSQDLPMLFFKTVDDISGLVRYEVNIGSLEEKGFVVDADENNLKVPSLEIGPHTAMVKAIDKAGNEVISTVDFAINPIETPVIKNYSQELQPNDKFFMSGTTLPDVNLIVYLQKGDGRVITKQTTSDKNGLWYLITEEKLENGRYVAWIEAINSNGLKSEPSPKISFLVTPPVFTRLGSFVINYFTVFTSLIFMIILIIISGVFLTNLIRKKLKKETYEVEEVLHDNMESLKDLVDSELIKISKLKSVDSINKEKVRLKGSLKEKIETTEKKIMKEIKDVEKLLK